MKVIKKAELSIFCFMKNVCLKIINTTITNTNYVRLEIGSM